jgi:ubiquinone/menaquinone biosynthesis C-methylase UbiE
MSKTLRRRISDTVYQLGPARYYQPAYAHIAATIGLESGSFLDVGCGPGWLSLHVAAGKLDIDAIGIDTSLGMVEAARRNKGGRLNITIREMDAADIKFPEATFDVAAAVQSAHHWSDTPAILGEIYRVLKPGGRFFLYEADRERTVVPEGWIQRRLGFPSDALLTAGWRRFGMNSDEWSRLEVQVRSMDFGNIICDEHGFYRRMVLTK